MPGSVANASPTSVFPQTLCTAFAEIRDFPLLISEYHDGTRQRGQLGSTSRRTFKQSKRLTAAQNTTLKTFWDSVSGGLLPFLFYNPFEPGSGAIGSNYDATGNNTQGRYTVVFRGGWQQTTELGRTAIPAIEFAEVA